MIIIFDSKTGNVGRFVKALGMDSLQIEDGLVVNEDFILITYTTGMGQVPDKTARFIENNREHMRGVASSGNRNWGANYGKSAHIISYKYKIPILLIFELSGTPEEIDKFKREVDKLVNPTSKMD